MLILRDLIIKKIPALKRYYENGFNMNQISFQSLYLDYAKRSLTDNEEHMKIYQPFLNEEAILPMELELVKSMFNS